MRSLLRSGLVLLLAAAGASGLALHGPRSPGASMAAGAVGPEEHQPSAEHQSAESVALSDAQVAAAGIELAQAGPGTLRSGLALNGMIQPNQEALVQVTPRFPGIVRDLRKRIGDRVGKGDLLGSIESNQSLTSYELRAPIAGTIIDRQASLGEYASEQKPAFVIADLSTVWVDFSVYRRDLPRVRVGDSVTIDAEDGGPGIAATISYLSPIGSSDTQSALARAVVGNADLRLRPGLFVSGRLALAAKPVRVAVKSSALQTYENRMVVFVRVGETFEARAVATGERDPEQVEIVSGLAAGDVYAARNSFVVKAELMKGSAAHDD
jgi:cobalt-zinc-cadmium efflux system membrane fusion protein